MQVEVLASVMNEDAEALCKRMNLSTDAVVINQCGEDGEQELSYNGHRIRFYSYAERGVGKTPSCQKHKAAVRHYRARKG